MSATTITTSPNIAVFDSKIIADTCTGQFIIDALPSVFIGGGASNVLGVKVKVTNPYGVIIKDYGAGYDIAAPLSAVYQSNIPTQAGKLQYGLYTIQLELTDADSVKYYITKTINVCTYNEATNPCDERVRIVADCKNGRVTILITEPPYFKGFPSESKTQSWTLYFPTASGAVPLVTTTGNYSVQLFQGVYKLVGSVCATYNLTDNVYLRLGYSGTFEKNVKCLLDYTCIWPRIKQLNDNIKEDCSQAERDKNASIVLDALRLLATAELANDAGEDASEYIGDLEKLLGCVCTCECSGLPITNNTPSTNISIVGCNVDKNTVGLTDFYNIENYEYLVVHNPAQSVITVSAPALTSCVKSQTISFSAANAYAAVKTQIGNSTEYNFWAAVINNTLSTINAACLGYNEVQWTALTFVQKMAALVAAACAGGSACAATIENIVITESGNSGQQSVYGNVLISWDNVSGVYGVQIYVDGVLKGAVLSNVEEFEVVGVADGLQHSYAVIPMCSNGSAGAGQTGTFIKIGCPSITPPVVSSNNVNGVDCPYDLTGLISSPPVGITIEWHTANNTDASSLVADPTAVSSGVYYAFARNVDGCYSSSTVVTLVCDDITSCTAPQSLSVVKLGGALGPNLILFQSAAYPPPGNSYTVKRRLYSDPDVDGSYTTIGTPTYSLVFNKWTINDNTAVDNTLYVYKAISNCGGSPITTPSTTYNFANIDCPSVTLTPASDSVGYSFVNTGGEIDKYEVKIYDSTGTILIFTDTHVPAFSNPITGTFYYLTPSTDYVVKVFSFIGSYYEECVGTATTTTA